MAEDYDFNDSSPEDQSNRTFLMAVAGIGALLVLSMICLALYALVLAPAQEQRRIAQATEIILQNTQIAAELTQTVEADRATATLPPTQTSTPTIEDTPTQVVVIPTSTSTPFTTLPTQVVLTETAAAQQTIDAGAQLTPTPTATALPSTGFADEVGLPSLLMVGGLLLVVILFARRLRMGGSTS